MPLSNNQVLKYNGTKWSNSFINLSECGDVNIVTPSNNQVLTYNNSTSKWINQASTSGALTLLGTWNARTNTPTIVSSTGTNGSYYTVSVSGNTVIDGKSLWRYGDIIIFNGSTWDRITVSSDRSNTFFPRIDYTNYNFEAMKRTLEDISLNGINSPVIVRSYPVTATNNPAVGLVFNYKLNTILGGIASSTSVFNITDSATPAITTVSTTGLLSDSYYGWVYHTLLDRYYGVPAGQAASTTWHYYSGLGAITTYTGLSLASYAYIGGCYSPTQNRIYFVPSNQASQSTWHYISSTGTVVGYTHGATVVNAAYHGGVYSPTQNRIYFVPNGQAPQPTWHYIDCNTGNVVGYTHGVSAVNGAYCWGVYSPTQNRIYFVPSQQASQPTWHYVDCNTGNVVGYTHGITPAISSYAGGCYSPNTNRIYFSGYNQSSQTTWHYIQCDGSRSVPGYISTISS